MNRLLCFLTGGHRYVDTGLKCQQQSNPNWFTYRNECIKCGKVTEFELNVGAILNADMERFKKEKDNG